MREWKAKVGSMPAANIKKRPIKTLWNDGKPSEDRDEWARELQGHCAEGYDDTDESPEVQKGKSGQMKTQERT